MNPDIYGPIEDRLFYWTGENAQTAAISSGLETVRERIGDDDALLFYFSGHATTFGSPGEILLYDAFEGGPWGKLESGTSGLVSADWLVGWFNDLRAHQVVCILDSGGTPFFEAGAALRRGRFLISSANSFAINRNGLLTWYVRRAVQKLDRRTTVGSLYQILVAVDRLRVQKEQFAKPMHFYIRGSD